jgi:hypothetical protein
MIPLLRDPIDLMLSYSLWGCLGALVATLLTGAIVAVAARHVSSEGQPARAEATPNNGPSPLDRPMRVRGLFLFLFGLLLLVLATFPYVANNSTFVPWGDDRSRYAALTPFPVGILLLALGRAILRQTSPWLQRRMVQLVQLGFAAILVICALTWWDNYIAQQAVRARDLAIFHQIERHPQARDVSIYCLYDLFEVQRSTRDLNIWQWSYLQCGIHGQPRSIAWLGDSDSRPLSEQKVKDLIWDTTIPYALTGIDPAGKQAVVIVRPAYFRTHRTPFTYLYLKYCHPERLDDLYEKMVQLEVIPAPWDSVASSTTHASAAR